MFAQGRIKDIIAKHRGIIQLILAYTLLIAFVFTVVITCLSLISLIKFDNPKQQEHLFYVLIVELVVLGIAFFKGFLKGNSKVDESSQLINDDLQLEFQAELKKKIDQLRNTNNSMEIEQLSDSLGLFVRQCNKDIIDALLYRIGDPQVQDDPDVEDAVCRAFIRIGIMHDLGNLNFKFVELDNLNRGIRKLIEKNEMYIPRKYFK